MLGDERELLHFRVHPAVAETIRKLAERDERSVSNYVARMIESAVEKHVQRTAP